MIPTRIRQIIMATAVSAALALIGILAYDRGAGVAFAATTGWMLANLVVWTVVMKIALQPGDQKPGVGLLLGAITAKIFLLLGGVIALRIFAPYSREQIYGIIAGISSVLLVAVLKALGCRIAAWSKAASPDKKEQAAKL